MCLRRLVSSSNESSRTAPPFASCGNYCHNHHVCAGPLPCADLYETYRSISVVLGGAHPLTDGFSADDYRVSPPPSSRQARSHRRHVSGGGVAGCFYLGGRGDCVND